MNKGSLDLQLPASNKLLPSPLHLHSGWFTRQTEDSNFSNIVDLLFNTVRYYWLDRKDQSYVGSRTTPDHHSLSLLPSVFTSLFSLPFFRRQLSSTLEL